MRPIIWIRMCVTRGVTPASTSGRRRSKPRARQMASLWLKRYTLGRFTLRFEARFRDDGNVQGPLGEFGLRLWHDRKAVPVRPDFSARGEALAPK